MDQFLVKGPCKLSGKVKISAAKNACLPLLAATILSQNPVELTGLPELQDIKSMLDLLNDLGLSVKDFRGKERVTTLQAKEIKNHKAKYEIVRTMRASILVLGPLLARLGKAEVSFPGGCAIGSRPIDIHLEGLEKMGAEISLEDGYIKAFAPKGLFGVDYTFPFPSVTATENLICAAALAKGTSKLKNVAMEPEISDLCFFLKNMGVEIEGIGSHELIIHGREELLPLEEPYRPIPDRIETGTYLVAALMTNSSITIEECRPDHLTSVLHILEKMGGSFEVGDTTIWVKEHGGTLKGTSIDTAPYPGIPTDMQAQLMALTTQIEGSSLISEHIFENRFMHVPELKRLGANIILKGNTAYVEGKKMLSGAPVMCTDLRASAALVLAALCCSGETLVRRIYHIDRGYENIDVKLNALGANIERQWS